MSTGDQSEYMRGKMAERGTSQGVQFSRDGFDRWAESTAPARAGQMEKMPAETQMVNTGGAMSVAQAKRLAKKYGQPVTDMVEGVMRGGRSFLGIEVPAIVEQVIDYGEKVLNFALLVNDKLPEIIEGIQDEIIDNDQDPAITENDRNIARKLLPVLNDAKTGLNMLKNVKSYADKIKSFLSSVGVGGRNCGGAAAGKTGKSSAEQFADAVDYLRKRYDQVRGIFDFITKNGKFLRQMLKLRALHPIGKQILDKIDPILAIVGAGKGGRRKQTCECSDDEYHGPSRKPMRGGFFPGIENMFGQQKQEATMMPMQGSYGMIGGPQGSPMGDDGGMQMDNYDMSTGKYESTVAARPSSDAAAKVEKLRQKIKLIDESDMPSNEKREKVMKLEKQIEDLQMRGGAANPELIKRIEAEINRLKNMRQDGARATSAKQRIQELESQLQRLMMRGGFLSRLARKPKPIRMKGGFFPGMDNMFGQQKYESTYDPPPEVEVRVNPRKKELMAKMAKVKKSDMPHEEKMRMLMDLQNQLEELNMRGGRTSYVPTVSSSRGRKPSDTDVTSRPVGGRKPSARGEIVKKVMREQGLSLPEASKYVKQKGLY